MTQGNLNHLENNEIPKTILEKSEEEKETSPDKFLEIANIEEKKFKQETANEISKLNSVDLDQSTFEKIKNETAIERDLSTINTEAENIISKTKNQIGVNKSLAEMRAKNISNKIRTNFQSESDFIEANNIALKINMLIDSLPEEKQIGVLKKFLNTLNNAKDIYFYKELHDEILEEKKNTGQPKQEIDMAQPDYKNTISNQTLYINGELRSIQIQYFDQPYKVRVNFGQGWEIMDKEELSKIYQESEKVKNQQNINTKKITNPIIEEIPLTQEDILKDFLYTQNMTADQIKAHMTKSPEERKRLHNSLIIEQENFEDKKEPEIIEEKISNLNTETNKNEKQTQNEQSVKTEDKETLIPSAEEIVNEKFLYKDVLPIENYEKNKLWARDETGELKENQRQYAEAYQTILKNESQKLKIIKSEIKNLYNKIMNQLGVDSSIYGQSETWIDWDIAKQKYLFNHPEKSNKNYNLGNPFGTENQEIIKDIINRHVGWEILGYVKNNPDFVNTLNKNKDSYTEIITLLEKGLSLSKLHSYQLSKLGKLIQENREI